MDPQASRDKDPGLVAPEKGVAQAAIADEVTEDDVNEKGIRAEKFAYYGLFAANNGIGPYQ